MSCCLYYTQTSTLALLGSASAGPWGRCTRTGNRSDRDTASASLDAVSRVPKGVTTLALRTFFLDKLLGSRVVFFRSSKTVKGVVIFRLQNGTTRKNLCAELNFVDEKTLPPFGMSTPCASPLLGHDAYDINRVLSCCRRNLSPVGKCRNTCCILGRPTPYSVSWPNHAKKHTALTISAAFSDGSRSKFARRNLAEEVTETRKGGARTRLALVHMAHVLSAPLERHLRFKGQISWNSSGIIFAVVNELRRPWLSRVSQL